MDHQLIDVYPLRVRCRLSQAVVAAVAACLLTGLAYAGDSPPARPGNQLYVRLLGTSA